MKICKKCLIEKPLSEYHNHKLKKDGKAIYCKACNNFMMKPKTKEQALRDTQNYKLRHPEKVKYAFKSWYENNKKVNSERRKKLNSTPERQAKIKAWQIKYRDISNEKRRNRTKSPKQIIEKCLRDRFNKVIIRLKSGTKYKSCLDLIGCDLGTLKKHIELQFIEGMDWGNHGNGIDKWNIDHIQPLCTFNLFELEQQILAFNYLNLRPMWFIDNIKRPRKSLLWQK